MGGIELTDDGLIVDRAPNDLDHLAIMFSGILRDLEIAHVFVSGYVAILTGRSRATEDIDVLIERIDANTIEKLVGRLEGEGLWGPAMPLSRMKAMLEDNIWIAREDKMVPHLKVKYVTDRFDRASLQNRIPAQIAGTEVPTGPLELQIPYKLWMGSKTDIEDAVHLYVLFEESLSMVELEQWISELGVEEEYERLKRA